MRWRVAVTDSENGNTVKGHQGDILADTVGRREVLRRWYYMHAVLAVRSEEWVKPLQLTGVRQSVVDLCLRYRHLLFRSKSLRELLSDWHVGTHSFTDKLFRSGRFQRSTAQRSQVQTAVLFHLQCALLKFSKMVSHMSFDSVAYPPDHLISCIWYANIWRFVSPLRIPITVSNLHLLRDIQQHYF